MANLQINSLFTEEYGKNLSETYQYNPIPNLYTRPLTNSIYTHRAKHPV